MTLVDKVEKLAQEVRGWQKGATVEVTPIENGIILSKKATTYNRHGSPFCKAACREYSGILRGLRELAEGEYIGWLEADGLAFKVVNTWKRVLSGSLDDGGSLGKS